LSLAGPGAYWSSICSALAILVTKGVTVVVAAGEAVGQLVGTLRHSRDDTVPCAGVAPPSGVAYSRVW